MRFPIWPSIYFSHRSCRRNWAKILIMSAFGLYLSGCDNSVKDITVSELILNPSMLYIGNPPSGVRFTEGSLTLTNGSKFDLTVTELRLVEEDDLKELSIIDAEQWNSPVNIPAGEIRTISIMWNSQDELRDLATLTIISNAGEQTINIETEPPRAKLSITSTVDINEIMGQKRIKLSSAIPGESQSINVKIKSLGILPLRVSDICLSLSGETCFESLQDFRLCEEENATSDSCLPLLERGALNLEEERVFSVLFEPKLGELRTSQVYLYIMSNAYTQQEETIKLIGVPCLSSIEDESCRSFHYIEAGRLSIGAQQMTSETGQQLNGDLLPSSHLSHSSKLNLYLKGSLSP